MRSTTLICALVAALELATGTALAAGGGWTWPVRGPVLTTYRNGDDPYAAGQHRGIDIGAPVGARVVAATAGTVTFAGVVGTSGLTISERTAEGSFDLSYLHLSSVAVHRGDAVAAGAELGAVGVSGQRSVEQPHLHFGVRDSGARGAYRDPLDFLAPPPPSDAPEPGPAPVAVPAPAGAGPAPAASAAPAVPAPAQSSLPGLPVPSPLPSPGAGADPQTSHSHAGRLPVHTAVTTLHARSHGHPGGAASSPAGTVTAIGAHASGSARSLPAPRSAHRPRGAPDPTRGPGTARPAAAPRVPPPVHAQRGRAGRGGLDVGWLLACLGLVAAAAVLGRPGAGPTPTRGRRPRIATLLRPTARGGGAR
jgi:hypothetical protein